MRREGRLLLYKLTSCPPVSAYGDTSVLQADFKPRMSACGDTFALQADFMPKLSACGSTSALQADFKRSSPKSGVKSKILL